MQSRDPNKIKQRKGQNLLAQTLSLSITGSLLMSLSPAVLPHHDGLKSLKAERKQIPHLLMVRCFVTSLKFWLIQKFGTKSGVTTGSYGYLVNVVRKTWSQFVEEGFESIQRLELEKTQTSVGRAKRAFPVGAQKTRTLVGLWIAKTMKLGNEQELFWELDWRPLTIKTCLILLMPLDCRSHVINMTGKLNWQKKFLGSPVFRLWHGYCCLFLTKFKVRARNIKQS